jgi:endonuclease VIII
VPEGDTIHHAANSIRPVLLDRVPDEIATPHPRFARDRWPERLAGRVVRAVDAHGKHLFLRFEGGLTLHSHLRMTGAWKVFGASSTQWSRHPRRAWLTIRAGGYVVVQFDGPVLELLRDSRTRLDPHLAGLGPDILARDFDEARFLRRLREDDPTRAIGDTLLDQHVVAGLGTIWRSEACWRAELDPWRPTGEVDDEAVLRAVRAVQPPMRRSARDGFQQRLVEVYGRSGLPCPRCGPPNLVRAGTQGDNNRRIFWCPNCQR